MSRSDIITIIIAASLTVWPIILALKHNEERCHIYGEFYRQKVNWTIMNGCQIEQRPGIFIPLTDWLMKEDVK